MQILSWLSYILVAATVVLADEKAPVAELKIDTTYMPAECPAKAQPGDAIRVHYVRISSIVILNCYTDLLTPYLDRNFIREWKEI
jgi:hypothetical protein